MTYPTPMPQRSIPAHRQPLMARAISPNASTINVPSPPRQAELPEGAEGVSPPATMRKAAPEEPAVQAKQGRLRAPVSPDDCAISQRTIMNSAS